MQFVRYLLYPKSSYPERFWLVVHALCRHRRALCVCLLSFIHLQNVHSVVRLESELVVLDGSDSVQLVLVLFA